MLRTIIAITLYLSSNFAVNAIDIYNPVPNNTKPEKPVINPPAPSFIPPPIYVPLDLSHPILPGELAFIYPNKKVEPDFNIPLEDFTKPNNTSPFYIDKLPNPAKECDPNQLKFLELIEESIKRLDPKLMSHEKRLEYLKQFEETRKKYLNSCNH